MDEGWKSWFCRSAGFGAGLAVTLTLLIGIWIWYSGRPKPPKPWDTKSITSEYDYVDTDEKHELVFYYTLQNNSDFDFEAPDNGEIILGAKLAKENSASLSDKDIVVPFPLFVPAHGRVRTSLTIPYPCPLTIDTTAPHDERWDQATQLAKYVKVKLGNLDGFLLYDTAKRYEIIFPNGWTEMSKRPLKVIAGQTPQSSTR